MRAVSSLEKIVVLYNHYLLPPPPPPLIQEFLTLALDYINIYNNLKILFYISSQKCSIKNGALAATDKRTVYKTTVTSYSI
jgi:hypothetical protein